MWPTRHARWVCCTEPSGPSSLGTVWTRTRGPLNRTIWWTTSYGEDEEGKHPFHCERLIRTRPSLFIGIPLITWCTNYSTINVKQKQFLHNIPSGGGGADFVPLLFTPGEFFPQQHRHMKTQICVATHSPAFTAKESPIRHAKIIPALPLWSDDLDAVRQHGFIYTISPPQRDAGMKSSHGCRAAYWKNAGNSPCMSDVKWYATRCKAAESINSPSSHAPQSSIILI